LRPLINYGCRPAWPGAGVSKMICGGGATYQADRGADGLIGQLHPMLPPLAGLGEDQ